MKLFIFILYLLHASADDEYMHGDDYIIGASAAQSHGLPFVLSFNFMERFHGISSCTGSLITRSWFVSAVHCTFFPVDQKKEGCNSTPKYMKIRGRYLKASCENLANGDTKITTYDPPSMVWLGINNFALDMHSGTATNIRVSYIIQPKGAYLQGGTYGSYGGYDIILGKLAKPAPAKFTPACVPAPSFVDITKSSLAGYGKYTRNKCITNSYGPMKSHYCSTEADMQGNGYKKRDSSGQISFFDGVENITNHCSTNPTPSSYDKICENFLSVSGYQFKKHSNAGKQWGRDGVDEIHLLQISPRNEIIAVRTCYRDKPDSYGWCQTSGDFTDLSAISLSVDNLVYSSKDWGFCTRECQLSGNGEAEHGVLRTEENVDVLKESECDKFLNISLNNAEVAYRPKILCIGEQLSFRSEYFWTEETDLEHARAWEKAPETFIENNKDELKQLNEQPDELDNYWSDWFLESAGTCKGDSGGPMFTLRYQAGRGQRFILTGSVSGGRGKTGNCGGINNPTHYVRIKMFYPWVKTYAGDDQDWCEMQ